MIVNKYLGANLHKNHKRNIFPSNGRKTQMRDHESPSIIWEFLRRAMGRKKNEEKRRSEGGYDFLFLAVCSVV